MSCSGRAGGCLFSFQTSILSCMLGWRSPLAACQQQEGQEPFACSSPNFAQSVVSFWISNNGLNSNYGFVDLGLQFTELLYM